MKVDARWIGVGLSICATFNEILNLVKVEIIITCIVAMSELFVFIAAGGGRTHGSRKKLIRWENLVFDMTPCYTIDC